MGTARAVGRRSAKFVARGEERRRVDSRPGPGRSPLAAVRARRSRGRTAQRAPRSARSPPLTRRRHSLLPYTPSTARIGMATNGGLPLSPRPARWQAPPPEPPRRARISAALGRGRLRSPAAGQRGTTADCRAVAAVPGRRCLSWVGGCSLGRGTRRRRRRSGRDRREPPTRAVPGDPDGMVVAGFLFGWWDVTVERHLCGAPKSVLQLAVRRRCRVGAVQPVPAARRTGPMPPRTPPRCRPSSPTSAAVCGQPSASVRSPRRPPPPNSSARPGSTPARPPPRARWRG